jgi:hypothetical protein
MGTEMKNTTVELISENAIHGGIQKLYRAKNGYGASVVRHSFSYGASRGLWELAVITFPTSTSDNFYLVYDTPITDDVMGDLTQDDVDALLERIALLPASVGEEHGK